jgi:peptide/nickel transport system permease protein
MTTETAVVSDPSIPQTGALSVWRRLRREPSAIIGAILIAVFVILAIFASWIAPYDPNASDWMVVREAPSLAHLLGTDDLGRDVLSRVIFGARASLAAGVVSVLVALAIGVPLGLMAGFFGGVLDPSSCRRLSRWPLPSSRKQALPSLALVNFLPLHPGEACLTLPANF